VNIAFSIDYFSEIIYNPTLNSFILTSQL